MTNILAVMTENRRRRLLADLESWRPRREGESLIEWARRISESEGTK